MSCQVDGMDILTVREATRFAADHTRSGKVTSEIIEILNLFQETRLEIG